MLIDQAIILKFPKINDPRGNLTFIEEGTHVPFDIKRVYYVYDVPGGSERGGHAHKETFEVLVALSGSFEVVINDGENYRSFYLNSPHSGLFIPPMLWRELKNFSSGSVCLVLASEFFNEEDYYRDFEIFKKASY